MLGAFSGEVNVEAFSVEVNLRGAFSGEVKVGGI